MKALCYPSLILLPVPSPCAFQPSEEELFTYDEEGEGISTE